MEACPRISATSALEVKTGHELSQISKAESLRAHISDFWNKFDFLSLSTIFAAYMLRALEWAFGATGVLGSDGKISYKWSTTLLAIALPATYFNMFFYFQGFNSTGELIRVTIGIIRNVRVVVIILAICMGGFATGFYILFEGFGDHDNEGAFANRSPLMSFLYSYSLMLGGFTPSETEGSLNTVVLAMLLMIFTYFINIVMLNLLITIMGDIFDRIQQTALADFFFGRANIIMEFEATISAKQKENKEWFPTWLQVLVPTLENDDDIYNEDWVGRVRALKNTVNRVRNDLKDSTKARMESEKRLEKKLEENEKERKEEVKALKLQLEENEKKRAEENQKLEKMLRMLCANSNLDLGEEGGGEIEGETGEGGGEEGEGS